jgi:hypothetical protein
MRRGATLVPSVLLAAVVLVGCQARTLEFDVLNRRQHGVVVEVVGPAGAAIGVRELIGPGGGRNLTLEEPGPGGWAVAVDGRVIFDWEDWPNDGAVLDLTIVLEADGSVGVQDVP